MLQDPKWNMKKKILMQLNEATQTIAALRDEVNKLAFELHSSVIANNVREETLTALSRSTVVDSSWALEVWRYREDKIFAHSFANFQNFHVQIARMREEAAAKLQNAEAAIEAAER